MLLVVGLALMLFFVGGIDINDVGEVLLQFISFDNEGEVLLQFRIAVIVDDRLTYACIPPLGYPPSLLSDSWPYLRP